MVMLPRAQLWELKMLISIFSSLQEISLSYRAVEVEWKTVICSGGNLEENRGQRLPSGAHHPILEMTWAAPGQKRHLTPPPLQRNFPLRWSFFTCCSSWMVSPYICWEVRVPPYISTQLWKQASGSGALSLRLQSVPPWECRGGFCKFISYQVIQVSVPIHWSENHTQQIWETTYSK